MAFDQGLAQRIREHFVNRDDVLEKKMFAGLCFMISSHMCCGIVKDTLVARVGPDNYEICLSHKNAKVMDFTGRAMKGMVYIDPAGIYSDWELAHWLNLCIDFVETLPPKIKDHGCV